MNTFPEGQSSGQPEYHVGDIEISELFDSITDLLDSRGVKANSEAVDTKYRTYELSQAEVALARAVMRSYSLTDEPDHISVTTLGSNPFSTPDAKYGSAWVNMRDSHTATTYRAELGGGFKGAAPVATKAISALHADPSDRIAVEIDSDDISALTHTMRDLTK
jgi:hypothetical protein